MDDATRSLLLSYGADALLRHFGRDGAASLAAVTPAGLPDGAAPTGDDGGKPPWAVPNAERPANPYALATLALGREATTEADVERAFGMPFGRVIAAGGPLFNPDLSKLPGAARRPAGALDPAADPATSGAFARAAKATAPAFDATKLAFADGPRAPGGPIPGLGSNPRPATAPVANFRDLRDPAEILAQMSMTSSRWMERTCIEQAGDIYNRQLNDRGMPASWRDAWFQWGAVNGAYASRGVDPAAGLYYWLRRGPYLHGAPLVTDAVQGVVGNCFFVAALAGAAWVRPEVIRAANWRGGGDAARRPGIVNFYNPGRASLDAPISASEASPSILLFSPDDNLVSCSYPYCRSPAYSRSWAQAYEKAMAAWRTGQRDTPPMGVHTSYYVDEATHPAVNIAGGLGTSMHRLRYGLGDAWRFITGHSELTSSGDRKASAVLIATSSGTPPGANIAPRHCYTVLGYRLVAGSLAQQKVVLRNPWGRASPGDPRDNVGEWLGLRLGQDGVGVMNLEPFYNSFLNISGNWYGTRGDYDYGTDERWVDFSR